LCNTNQLSRSATEGVREDDDSGCHVNPCIVLAVNDPPNTYDRGTKAANATRKLKRSRWKTSEDVESGMGFKSNETQDHPPLARARVAASCAN